MQLIFEIVFLFCVVSIFPYRIEGDFGYDSYSLQPPQFEGHHNIQPGFGSGDGEGYIYPVPRKNRLKYPEEFERRHQKQKEKKKEERRDKIQTERERPREQDRERQKLADKLDEKLRQDEQRLQKKEEELGAREERLLREREKLEIERQRDETLRQQLVDQLVAEHRNKTLQDLEEFGENLKKNQKLEDNARDTVGGGRQRLKFTKESEEIIRKEGQPDVINRNTERREEEIGRDGVRRTLSEESSRESSNSRTGSGPGAPPANPSGGSGRVETESSRSSSFSRSSSSSSASEGSGAPLTFFLGGDDDSDASGSAFVPVRKSLHRSYNSVPPIANDPVFLSVASLDEVLDRTGAAGSRSWTLGSSNCPPGNVYSTFQQKCIRWG